MQCYTELTPPTAVTHSLSLPFVSATSNNLIIAKTSLLQIFAITTISVELDTSTINEEADASEQILSDEDESFLVADSALQRSEHAKNTKLVLVTEYALSGTIISMVRVKTQQSKSGGEALLLAFRDAKLGLVEWDPERNGLSTISIHYYEQDEMEGSPWATKLGNCVNYLSVDPQSRCAALKFGSRNLAILPFRQGDDDTAMDDWDEELDGPRPERTMNGATINEDTPYSPSFVLRFSSLDPSLIHPIHLAFLYEYREPTFGILASTITPSSSLLNQRKDRLTYMVFTLDLHQKASTTILAVSGLPYDLFKIIALPPPIGGALLVGGNELIHIDQSGKANGVAVNSFAKQCTSFGLSDQAELDMRLEDCSIEQLSMESGEMLVILHTGELAILSFRMDGRTVSGLNVRRISTDAGGSLIASNASCVSLLGRNSIFVGSEGADGVVIGWTKKQGSRRKSQIEVSVDEDSDMLDDDLDDDDLYGDGPSAALVPGDPEVRADSTNSNVGDYTFRIHDTLLNIGPLRDVTFSKPNEKADAITGDLQLVAASGCGKEGSLIVLKREVEPEVIGRFEFPEAQGMWTMIAKKPVAKTIQQSKSEVKGESELEAQFDRLMIVSKLEDGVEESAVYALTAAGFEALADTEFEPAAGATIEAGTIGNGMRVIQVLRSEVRSYDGDLGLAQILPMIDEETGAEPKIVSASISDPFLLLIRDDASIFVASCDEVNELEELEREDDTLLATKWISGCLYTDSKGLFASQQNDKGSKIGENILMFLLSAGGAIYIYALPDLSKPVYVAEGICFIPTTISPDFAARRSGARETLTEIVVADLGDSTHKSPYLILRAANDDLTIYEPFRLPTLPLSKALYFTKAPNPHLSKSAEVAAVEPLDESQMRNNPMRVVSDLSGYSAVFLPGGSPSFILKSAKSVPRLLGLRGAGVRGMSGFHTAGCDRGFIYVDLDGFARVCQLPAANLTETGMVMRRVEIGEQVTAVTYHLPMDSYVIGTSISDEFELPKDDETHKEWQKEEIQFKPLVERSFVKLVSPQNWSVIDTVELDPCEVIMCVKTLNLEISEHTHEKKLLVTVGTALAKGEDLAVRGRVYVYEVVTVVPEPDRPETNKKLKLIAKEEIPRGAVTAISEIGTQGFMIIAQGQKCMVRGLKEDGTLLPVAFLDMNTYVTTVKELPGTGICVMADALKGAWLTGYSEEPYKMTLFGKQTQNMELVAADIMPIGGELFIVVADSDCNLHILQFDPEHPKTLHGQLLLHRTTFALGHLPTTMTLLPRTKATTTGGTKDVAAEETIPEHEIILTMSSGAIGLLSPLNEAQYRRLSTLTNLLGNAIYHAAGLNPKAYRINDEEVSGRIVDGMILARWGELGSQRRSEIATRVGGNMEKIRGDLEELRSRLGYL